MKRSIKSWKELDKLSAKIGNGRYVIVAYDKIKRITIPLPNNHLLFVSLEGEEFGNIQNIMASLLMVNSILTKMNVKPDYEKIAQAIYSFGGLEHRMEKIGEYEGRVFINDSKATTIGALEMAIKSLKGSGIIIMGGRMKGDDYSRLNESMKGKVRGVVLIGESRDYLSDVFKDQNHQKADDLDDAVIKAMKMSSEGDSIILSPACASFDMYNNYEERGQFFKNTFTKLSKGEISWI